ncbi:MAG: hypothetical protein AAF743_08945, partial [Planctomycetota bacterium]
KLPQISRSSDMMVAADATQFDYDGSNPGLADQAGNSYYILGRLNSSSIYVSWNQFTAIGSGFNVPAGFAIDGVVPTPGTPVKFQSGQPTPDSSSWNVCDVAFRHNDDKSANLLFIDGHVGSARYNPNSEFWLGQADAGELTQRNVMIYGK